MEDADELETQSSYVRSSAVRYRCEECGYKWQVKDTEADTDEQNDTVSYDADEDLEPTICPLCGCSDILTL